MPLQIRIDATTLPALIFGGLLVVIAVVMGLFIWRERHSLDPALENNDGARILRRAYSYNDGVNYTAERWPPWKQGMEFDAGLLFVCYQRDPRTGFIKIFERMAKFDMMNQFITNTGSALFACPGGVEKGEFIGQALFAA